MENKKKGELSKEFWYFFIGFCCLFIIVLAVGFAVFANREDEVLEKEESGGNIVLNYTNNISGLKIINATPTTDAIGIKNNEDGQYFDFSIDTKLDNAPSIEYEIAAIKDSTISTISNDDIKIYLEKENSGSFTKVFGPAKFSAIKESTKLGSPEGSMVLTHSKIKKSGTENYRLRMWLSDKSVLTSGNYGIEIVVNGKAK